MRASDRQCEQCDKGKVSSLPIDFVSLFSLCSDNATSTIIKFSCREQTGAARRSKERQTASEVGVAVNAGYSLTLNKRGSWLTFRGHWCDIRAAQKEKLWKCADSAASLQPERQQKPQLAHLLGQYVPCKDIYWNSICNMSVTINQSLFIIDKAHWVQSENALKWTDWPWVRHINALSCRTKEDRWMISGVGILDTINKLQFLDFANELIKKKEKMLKSKRRNQRLWGLNCVWNDATIRRPNWGSVALNPLSHLRFDT